MLAKPILFTPLPPLNRVRAQAGYLRSPIVQNLKIGTVNVLIISQAHKPLKLKIRTKT